MRLSREKRLKTIFVQEAGWVAAWEEDEDQTPRVEFPIRCFGRTSQGDPSGDFTSIQTNMVTRIHTILESRPPYVDTVDGAVCAMEIMKGMNKLRAVLQLRNGRLREPSGISSELSHQLFGQQVLV